MKRAKGLLGLATLAAFAGPAMSAPTLQSCSPMVVTHYSDAGLSYDLSCDAGPWKLKYSGAIPMGKDGVTAQYRLSVSGPEGASFMFHRSARLPSPAQLGQVLMREAVLLDSGTVALRECTELGCSQYRPLTQDKEAVKAVVTIAPEVKRLRDEQQHLTDITNHLRDDLATTKSQCESSLEELRQTDQRNERQAQAKSAADMQSAQDIQLHLNERVTQLQTDLTSAKTTCRASTEAAVQAEQKKSSDALAQAQSDYRDLSLQLTTRMKAEAAAATKLADTDHRNAIAELTASLSTANNRVTELDTASHKQDDTISTLIQDRDQIRVDLTTTQRSLGIAQAALTTAKNELARASSLPNAQKKAYEFAMADLVAQHSTQIAALKQAMPMVNFTGILSDLNVPHIDMASFSQQDTEGAANSTSASTGTRYVQRGSRWYDTSTEPATRVKRRHNKWLPVTSNE